ncbi:MAG: epoxyqueuosine reductase QueH [Deltaproteobacteria bacterium]|nr:epoxyqueuosine reductase QueH [Deltaproteobacteria bacterium]MBW1962603.1 epoxyqueuosine reductase QueH [Deltaproteobacteria bacterium]MBW1993780.1 epoxyqueuosine reductase QueH [Deltaproteobacteria bacterium]MBW2154634.1 epoxyqueuosine reductase QueH [Deltaproteobacteria bacterium]
MKILLHICCAPCAIYPVETLRSEGFEVMGFFYRHNIHPYTECLKRQQTLASYAESIDLKVIYQKEYLLEEFLRAVSFRESARCSYCYHNRLESTARMARSGKFDCFSTTLLYSKYQNHDLLRSMGDAIGKSIGVPFYYNDFRKGWAQGVEASRRLNLYRQQYCGCIYSEKERYYKKD